MADTPTVCAHALKIAAFSIKSGMRGIDGGQKEAASAPPGQVAPGEMEGLHPCPRPSLTQPRRRSERWRRSGLKWRCCGRTFSSSRWERLLRWLTTLLLLFFSSFFSLPCHLINILTRCRFVLQALSNILSPQLSSIVAGRGCPDISVLRDVYSLLGEGGQRYPAIVLDSEA